jgi:hypothetical protein
MILINALATRAGGAALRVAEVARRAPRIWGEPLLVMSNREAGVDHVADPSCVVAGWPPPLDHAPAVPRRILEPAVLHRALGRHDVRTVLHYGTYVPVRTPRAVLNVLCFISLAPWDPGPGARSARNRILRWLFERTQERADIVVVQSAATRDFLQDRYPTVAGRLAIVRNGLSIPALPSTSGRTGFLVLGDIYGYRRIPDVVNAYSRLDEDLRSEHPLLIAGNTERDPAATAQVRSAIRRVGSGNVRLLGLLPRTEALTLIAQSRVFVSFASVENGPNALAEATAIGIPAALSDIPVHREFAGPAARFVSDVDALADAMGCLATAPVDATAQRNAVDTWDAHVAQLGHAIRSSVTAPQLQ